MSKRSRIGGQIKRDAVAFAEMVKRVDVDGSGEISYDEFVAEVSEKRGGGRGDGGAGGVEDKHARETSLTRASRLFPRRSRAGCRASTTSSATWR
jgi:hypothetical protein